MKRLIVPVLFVALIACSKNNKDKPEPAKAPSHGTAATAATGSTPAAKPSASKPAPKPADGLPAADVACSSDADCVAGYKLHPDTAAGRCCRGCSTEVATAASWKARRAACSAMGGQGCPLKKCAALTPVGCQDGQCVVKK